MTRRTNRQSMLVQLLQLRAPNILGRERELGASGATTSETIADYCRCFRSSRIHLPSRLSVPSSQQVVLLNLTISSTFWGLSLSDCLKALRIK